MNILDIHKVYDREILDKIYMELEKTGYKNRVYIVHTLDKPSDNLGIYDKHFVKIILKDFEGGKNELLDEILFEASYNKINLLVDKSGSSIEMVREFESKSDMLDLEYRVVGKEGFSKIDMTKADDELKSIVMEILNHPNYNKKPKFRVEDFWKYIKIDNKGDITDIVGENLGKIGEISFFDIYISFKGKTLEYIKEYQKDINKYEEEVGFKIELVEPWYFMGDLENVIEEIGGYKKRIFDIIKNLSSLQYHKLDDYMKMILRESRYIPLNEIIQLENRNDDIYIEEWFIELIKEQKE